MGLIVWVKTHAILRRPLQSTQSHRGHARLQCGETLKITYEAIPHKLVDQIILVDDGSTDKTLDVARQLQLTVFVHTRNFGYGANQKTVTRKP
jgi:Glycosyl transferase family 2